MSSLINDERIKLSVKSSNFDIVSTFASTEDDTKIFLLANNCNLYNWNNLNTGAIFGAKVTNINSSNENHEPYIAIKNNDGDHKLAQFGNEYIKLNRDVIPNGNENLSLGNPDNRWKDIWLSGNTIGLGDISLSSSSNEDGSYSMALTNNIPDDSDEPINIPGIQTGGLILKSTNGSTSVMTLTNDGRIQTKITTPNGEPAPANTDINGDLIVSKSITASNLNITSNTILQNLLINNNSNNSPTFTLQHNQNNYNMFESSNLPLFNSPFITVLSNSNLTIPNNNGKFFT